MSDKHFHSASSVKWRVLIEASKLDMDKNDGCKRYVNELLCAFIPLSELPEFKWEIDLYIEGKIYKLSEVKNKLLRDHHSNASLGNASFHHNHNYQSAKDFLSRTAQRFLPEKGFGYLLKTKHAQYVVRKKIEAKFKKLKLRLSSSNNRYDLIHLTIPMHLWVASRLKTKFITTVHDFTHIHYPDFHLKHNIANTQKGIDFSLKKNSYFIAISNSTKKDIVNFCKVKEEKIFTIYEAADQKKFKKIRRKN